VLVKEQHDLLGVSPFFEIVDISILELLDIDGAPRRATGLQRPKNRFGSHTIRLTERIQQQRIWRFSAKN